MRIPIKRLPVKGFFLLLINGFSAAASDVVRIMLNCRASGRFEGENEGYRNHGMRPESDGQKAVFCG